MSDDDQHGTHVILFLVMALLIGNFFRAIQSRLPFTIPYTAAIFLVGVGWGALRRGTLADAADVVSSMGSGLLLMAFLPPLVFESSFDTKWYMFRRSLSQIMLLSVVGVLISVCLTAVIYKGVLESGESWPEAFLIGAVLSATDPVAVVALMRTHAVPPQVITLLEGESLLNDGFAMVAFRLFFNMVSGEDNGPGAVVGDLLQLSIGAILLGLVWAVAVIFLLGRVQGDSTVESTLPIVMAYLLFYVAEEEAQVSGVLAVVLFGLCFPWFGKSRFSPGIIHQTEHFLSNFAYISETLIFVICGAIVADAVNKDTISSEDWGKAIALWLFVILTRGMMLGLLSPALMRTGNGFGFRRAAVMTWGGLRGAVSLALALDVKVSFENDPKLADFANKTAFYTSVVVILTLVINAPLTAPLLNWLSRQRGYRPDAAQVDSNNFAIDNLVFQSQEKLEELKLGATYTGTNWDKVASYVLGGVRNHAISGRKVSIVNAEDKAHLSLKQGRLKFLEHVQGHLRRQEAEGALRWSSAESLKYLTDLIIDSIDRSRGDVTFSNNSWIPKSSTINAADQPSPPPTPQKESAPPSPGPRAGAGGIEIDHSVEIVEQISSPPWVHWLRKLADLMPWPIKEALEIVIETQLLDAISATDGLIRAFEGACRDLDTSVPPEVAEAVFKEATRCVRAAEARLEKLHSKYPLQFQQVRSVASAQHITAFQLRTIEDATSSYSTEVRSALTRTLKRQQNRLVLNRQTFRERTSFARGLTPTDMRQSQSVDPADGGRDSIASTDVVAAAAAAGGYIDVGEPETLIMEDPMSRLSEYADQTSFFNQPNGEITEFTEL